MFTENPFPAQPIHTPVKRRNTHKSPIIEGKTWTHEKGDSEHRDQACSSSWISDDLPTATGSADGTGSQAFKNKHSYTTHWMRSPCWSHCSSILSQNNRVGFKKQHHQEHKASTVIPNLKQVWCKKQKATCCLGEILFIFMTITS